MIQEGSQNERNENSTKKKRILIFGDHIEDVFFYPDKEEFNIHDFNFGILHYYHSKCFLGGNELVKQLLEELIDDKERYEIIVYSDNKKYVTREILQKYPSLAPSELKYDTEEIPVKNIFRGEKFLGIDVKESDDSTKTDIKLEESHGDNAILYIINDIGKGFRKNNKLWAQILEMYKNNPPEKIILRLSPPFDFDLGDFSQSYKDFLKEAENQLIIYINLKDLRLLPCATISYQLSWEKTVEELLYHMINNESFQGLRTCKKLVIRIGLEGVIVFDEPKHLEGNGGELFFDPLSYEDRFLIKPEGNIQGISLAFLVGLINEWVINEKNKNSHDNDENKIVDQKTIESGLNLAWNMWIWGYGQEDKPERVLSKVIIKNHNYYRKKRSELEKKLDEEICKKRNKRELKNPLLTDLDLYRLKLNSLASVKIERDNVPIDDGISWTILSKNKAKRSIGEIAYAIVQGDISNLMLDFPVLKIGKLITVDRGEIESLRSVKNIIKQYLKSNQQKTPLSIGVFGPPGSGKSFAVKQLLADRKDIDNIEFLSFNLSQFTNSSQLSSVFHKIRDYSLIGKLPLVFFDEFDCKLGTENYGWLKYFLSPMQDGVFFDGENVHPLGRAIFIFAGGISSEYRDFIKICEQRQQSKDDAKNRKDDAKKDDAKIDDAKIRDFISRLKGYIDIVGCNPIDQQDDRKTKNKSDEMYQLKRAIILRSIILEKAPQIVESNIIRIDYDLLRAFIKVKRYNHGVRSIQSIVEMSNLRDKSVFDSSALPADNQLKLHVKATQFKNLLLRDIHYKESSKKIADRLEREYQSIVKDLDPNDLKNIMQKDVEGYNRKELNILLVDYIPDILSDLGTGFYKTEKYENIASYSFNDKPKYHEFLDKNKSFRKFLDKIPELLEKESFQLYEN